MDNSTVSKIFNKVADLLEIKGENPFRIRAYRNAARTVEGLTKDVKELVENNYDFSQLDGIGKDLSSKIYEIVKTGNLRFLKELEEEFPEGVLKLMEIPGLGGKRIKTIYEKLNIKNIKELEEAAKKGRIKQLDGFGEKIEKNILDEIKNVELSRKRFKLSDATEIAESIIDYVKRIKSVNFITVAGSYRRRKETVGDLDIIVTCSDNKSVVENFVKYEEIDKVISKGETRVSVILKSGMQIDLRIISDESYGAALMYFTGSQEHNIGLRKICQEKGMKLNEYGLFKDERRIAGRTEEEVYRKLDMQYIPPELRENRGEIELALEYKIPKLIDIKDIKGDLHIHTTYTDGYSTIEEIALFAKDMGYEYIGISDHSKKVTVAHGLDEKKLLKQIEEIERLNSRLKNFTILKGIEVDILEDGTLDLKESVLKELDFVICSIHSKFNLSEDLQTSRVLKAMDSGYCSILGHPTGRLINQRKPYSINMEKIINKAKENKIIIELNSHPDRLDINENYLKIAKEAGVKICISTDAHSLNHLSFIKYGIGQARRGWLEKDNVINTFKIKDIRKILKSFKTI